MAGMLVVTTDDVPGYHVRAVLGEVVGVTARSHNPFSEGVKGMDGKPNPQLGIALLRWREDAVGKMIEAAAAMGANAIVGMRFDNRWITQLVSEICAYGTAVQVSYVVEETPPPPAAPPAPPPEPEPPAGPAGRHARVEDGGPRPEPPPAEPDAAKSEPHEPRPAQGEPTEPPSREPEPGGGQPAAPSAPAPESASGRPAAPSAPAPESASGRPAAPSAPESGRGGPAEPLLAGGTDAPTDPGPVARPAATAPVTGVPDAFRRGNRGCAGDAGTPVWSRPAGHPAAPVPDAPLTRARSPVPVDRPESLDRLDLGRCGPANSGRERRGYVDTDGAGATGLAAVLFDMDGTLVDSEKVWDVGLAELAARYGGALSAEARAEMVGTSMTESMAILHGDIGQPWRDETTSVDWLEERVKELFADGLIWRPGAQRLLAAVTAAGIPAALVTATRRHLVDVALETIGRTHFAAVVCGDEVDETKPHPRPYLTAATLLGVDIARCVAIEDSPTGVASALAAGARVLAVPCEVDLSHIAGVTLVQSLDEVDVEYLRRLAAPVPVGDRSGEPGA